MIRKITWLVVFAGLCSAWLYGAPQMASDKASTPQTVTGCLQKGTETGGFFLIGTDEKHWELYGNSDTALADHIGQTISITGTLANRTKAQEEVSQPHEKKETGSRHHADLWVSTLKVVSSTCGK